MTKVVKRNGELVDFQKEKITQAILKAMKNGSGIVDEIPATKIADEIESVSKLKNRITIAEIELLVFDKLIAKKHQLTAKAYEGYRKVREFQRETENSIYTQVEKLLDGTDEYLKTENANKNAQLVTTQRDYMAGIISTDITRRFLLPPEIVQAHDEGIIHFHDADYFKNHYIIVLAVRQNLLRQEG